MLAEVAKSLRDGESQGVPESLSVSREQVNCLDSILGNLFSLLLELMAHKLVRANSYSIDLKSTLESSLQQLPCDPLYPMNCLAKKNKELILLTS